MATTVLDPATNLPDKDQSSFKIKPLTAESIRTAIKYGPTADVGFIGTGNRAPNPEDFDFQPKSHIDNYELRALNQPISEQIGHGIVNLVGGTVLKMIEGAGYVGSSLGAIVSGDVNVMVDNGFSAYFSGLEDALKQAMPIYKTKEYLNGNVWDKMGTMAFWTDDFIDGASFLASAWLGAGAINAIGKSIGLYGKMARQVSKLSIAARTGRLTEESIALAGRALGLAPKAIKLNTRLANVAKGLDFLTVGAYNIASEASFEAKDLKDQYIASAMPLIKSGEKTMAQVLQEANSAARSTFWWNAAVLAPSNMLELSFMFKKFDFLKGRGIGFTGAASKPLTTLGKTGIFAKKAILSAATEGLYEENLQYAIQKYYQDMATDFDYNKDWADAVKGVFTNSITNFKDDEGLQNIVLGALLGWLPGGAYGVRSAKNEQKQAAVRDIAAGYSLANFKGDILPFLQVERKVDKDGNPTSKYEVKYNDKAETAFSEWKIKAFGEHIKTKYKNFTSLAKALESGNKELFNYLQAKILAEHVMFMVGAGATKSDLSTWLQFQKEAEEEELNKRSDVKSLDGLKEKYEFYEKYLPMWHDLYRSIESNHAGIFKFGNSEQARSFKQEIFAKQYQEAIFQNYWTKRKSEMESDLMELDNDAVSNLMEAGGFPTTDPVVEKKKAKLEEQMKQIDAVLKDSYDAMKLLMDQKTLQEEFDEREKKDVEAEKKAGTTPGTKGKDTARGKGSKGTAAILNDDGTRKIVTRFNAADAAANGYAVDDEESAKHNKHTNLAEGTKSVWSKKDDKNGHTHFVWTGKDGKILREGDVVEVATDLVFPEDKKEKKVLQGKYKVKTGKVVYHFDNGKLSAIRFIDPTTGKYAELPPSELPTKEGKPYKLKDLPLLYSLINEYLDMYESKEGVEPEVAIVTREEKDAALEEIRREEADKLIEEYWENTEYSNTPVSKVFDTAGSLKRVAGFFEGNYGELRVEGEQLIFYPYKKVKKSTGEIIIDEENSKVVGPINSSKTMSETGVSISRDALVDVETSSEDTSRITIEGQDYSIPTVSSSLNSIGYNEEGEPISITLVNSSGNVVTFTDPLIVNAVALNIFLLENVKEMVLTDLFFKDGSTYLPLQTDLEDENSKFNVYRKGKKWAVVRASNNREMSTKSQEYKDAVKAAKRIIGLTIEAYIRRGLYSFDKASANELIKDEIRRTVKILRSESPEEALRAKSEEEVATPAGESTTSETGAEQGKYSERKADLEGKIASLASEIETIEGEIERLSEEIYDDQEIIDEEKKTIKDSEKDVNDVKDSIKEGEKIIEDLERDLKKKEADIKRWEIEKDLKKYEEEKAEIAETLKVEEAELLELNQEEVGLKQKLNSNFNVLSESESLNKGTLEAIESEIKGIKTRLKEIEKRRLEIVSKRGNAAKELSDLDDLINVQVLSLSKLFDIEDSIEEVRVRIKSLEGQIEAVEARKAQLSKGEDIVKELEKELKDKETVLRELIKGKRELNSTLQKEEGMLLDLVAERNAKKKKKKSKKQTKYDSYAEAVYKVMKSGTRWEPIGKNEIKDEAYTFNASPVGIIHSASKISYVHEIEDENGNKEFVIRNHEFEDYIISGPVEGDIVSPHIDFENSWWGKTESRRKLKPRVEAATRGEITLTDAEVAELTVASVPEKFDANEVDTMPLGLTYFAEPDSEGVTAEFSEGLYLHNTSKSIRAPQNIKKKNRPAYELNAKLETRQFRAEVIKTLIQGGHVKVPVTGVSKGHYNNVTENRNIEEVLHEIDPDFDVRKAKIGIVVKSGFVKQAGGTFGIGFGIPGNVMLETEFSANGNGIIVKLNPTKLSKKHAALVLDVLQEANTKGKGGYKGTYSNKSKLIEEGTFTRKALLDLLVVQGKKYSEISDGKKDKDRQHLKSKQLYVDKVDGDVVLVFGTDSMPLFEPSKKEMKRYLKWAQSNKNYAIDGDNLGKKFKQTSFKILSEAGGVDIVYDPKKDNYTSMLIRSGMIVTDVEQYRNTKSFTKNPTVIIDFGGAGLDVAISEESANAVKTLNKEIARNATIKEKVKAAYAGEPLSDDVIGKADKLKEIEKESKKKAAQKKEKEILKSAEELTVLPVGTKLYHYYHTRGKKGLSYKFIGTIRKSKDGKRYLQYPSRPLDSFHAKILYQLQTKFKVKSLENVLEVKVAIKSADGILNKVVYSSPAETLEKKREKTKEVKKNSIENIAEEVIANAKKEKKKKKGKKKRGRNKMYDTTESKTKEEASTDIAAALIDSIRNSEVGFTDESVGRSMRSNLDILNSLSDDPSNEESQGKSNKGVPRMVADTASYDTEDVSKAFEWLKETLGENFTTRLQEGLIKLGGNKTAFGVTLKDGFTLSDQMEVGTHYHEAFHRVSLLYLTPDERTSIYKEARKRFKGVSEASNREVEEYLAEKFRDYILARKSDNPVLKKSMLKTVGKAIMDVFNTIWDFIKNLVGIKTHTIETLFRDIERGRFKNFTPSNENIEAFDKAYYRMFQVYGTSLQSISNDEQFQEVVQNMLYILVRSNDLIQYNEDTEDFRLNISTINKVKEIKYPPLFREVKKLRDNAKSNAIFINRQIEILAENPGDTSVIKGVKSRIFKNADIKDSKLNKALDKAFNVAINQTILFTEILEKPTVFTNALEDYLSSLGIATFRDEFSDQQMDEAIFDETNEDLSSMATWNTVAFKVDAKDNTAKTVKLLLSILPESNVESSLTGLFKFKPFGEMWETVMHDLESVVSVEEMNERMANLANTDISYRTMYAHIQSDETLKTQFYRTIQQGRLSFINALVKSLDGEAPSFSFVGASAMTLSRSILMEWNQTFSLYSDMFIREEGRRPRPNTEKFDKVFKKFKRLQKATTMGVANGELAHRMPLYKDQLVELLGDMGISMDVELLDSVLKEIDIDNPQVAFMNLLNNEKYLGYVFNKSKGIIGSLLRGEKIEDEKGYRVNYDNALKNERGIRFLAGAIANSNSGSLGFSVFGPKGNRYYTVMPHTYLSNMMGLFKHLNDEALLDKENAIYAANSMIVKRLLDRDEKFAKDFNLRTLSSMIVEGKDNGREYQDLSPQEEFLLRLYSNREGKYMLPTPADRKFIQFFEGVSRLGLDENLDYFLNQDGTFKEEVLQVFHGYATDEYNRIQLTVHQLDELLDGNFSHTNLVENLHFEYLEKGKKINKSDVILVNGEIAEYKKIVDSKGNINTLGKLIRRGGEYVGRGTKFIRFLEHPTVGEFNPTADNSMEYIQEVLSDRLNDEIKKASELRLIGHTKAGKGYFITDNFMLDEGILRDIRKDFGVSKKNADFAPRQMLAENMILTMFTAIETEKVITGDPATFKSNENMLKRIPLYTSTGENTRNVFPEDYYPNEELVHSRNYNVAVSDDIIFKTEFYDSIHSRFVDYYLNSEEGLASTREEASAIATAKLEEFSKANQTDGQTLITPEMWKALAIKLGEFTPDMDEAFNMLTSWDTDLSNDDIVRAAEIVMQPLKFLYLKTVTEEGQMFSIIDKMSMATLFPAMVKGTELATVLKRMQAIDEYAGETPIHQLKFKSAQKVGVKDIFSFYSDDTRTTLSDLTNITTYQQDFEFIRMQLDTVPHGDAVTSMGTQVKKSGFSNVELEGIYEFEGEDMFGADLVSELHNILGELSEHGRREFMKDLGLNLDYNIQDKELFMDTLKKEGRKADIPSYVLDSFRLDPETGKYYLELDAHPANRKWLQSRILAITKKSMVDLKLPGTSFIQMSDIGLSKIVKDTKQELQMFTNSGHIEAAISVRAFEHIIPKYDELSDPERIEWLEAHPEMTGITYRIPTQGMNSEYVVKIVRFLPHAAGNIIVLPKEGPALGGFDFDIDKLYLIQHNYNRNGEKIEFMDGTTDINDRYVAFIKGKTPREIYKYFNLIGKYNVKNIVKSYKSRVEGIEDYVNKMGEGHKIAKDNDALYDTIDYSVGLRGTTMGQELEDNYQLGKVLFHNLSRDVIDDIQEYLSTFNTLDLDIRDKTIFLHDYAHISLSENNVTGKDAELMKMMLTLYEERLEMYGFTPELLKSRKTAIEEEYLALAVPSKNFFDYLSSRTLGNRAGSKSDQLREVEVQEAETLAELAGFESLEDFSNEPNILKQNTKKALQNRLIDIYMNIYLDEKHFTYRSQPLPYGSTEMSNIADAVTDAENKGKQIDAVPLGSISPAYQVAVKAAYRLGSNLGIYALANSNFVIGQKVGIGLFDYLGIGNFTTFRGKKVTDLSQVYGIEETHTNGVTMKTPITEIYSAAMDGHVDLAANPYIPKLNLTTYNSDVVSLLIRMGMGYTTFKFTSQPILKELTKKVESWESNLGENKPSIKDIIQGLINKYGDLEDFSVENMQEVFNPQTLMEDIGREKKDSAYYVRQIRVLQAYEYLMPYADELKKAVLASRIDTKKIGMNMSQFYVYEVRRDGVLERESIDDGNTEGYGIRNFHRFYSETFLGPLHDNTVGAATGTLGNMVLEATPAFRAALHRILSSLGRLHSATPEEINDIATALYTQITSEFMTSERGLSTKKAKKLLLGDNSIPIKVSKIKNGRYLKGLKKNKLIKAFLYNPTFGKEGSPDFLAFKKPDDKWSKDSLARAWADMYYSDDEKVQKFALDLFYYSYLTSGFKATGSSFFDLAPRELLKEIGYSDFIEDKLEEYQSAKAMNGLIDGVFISNWQNKKLVKQMQRRDIHFLSEKGTIAVLDPMRHYKGINKRGDYVFSPFLVLDEWEDGKIIEKVLYKYTGTVDTDSGIKAVYYQIEKKGYSYKGNIIVEDPFEGSMFDDNQMYYHSKDVRKLLTDDHISSYINYTNSKGKRKFPELKGFRQIKDLSVTSAAYMDRSAVEHLVDSIEDETTFDPTLESPITYTTTIRASQLSGSDFTKGKRKKGIAIDSKQSGLGFALTNPTHVSPATNVEWGSRNWSKNQEKWRKKLKKGIEYEGSKYKDVEHAYQTITKIEGTKRLKEEYVKEDKPDYAKLEGLMADLIRVKFETYPELLEKIDNKGGLEFLLDSVHSPTDSKSYWETKGGNGFIKALAKAYLTSNREAQYEGADKMIMYSGGAYGADSFFHIIAEDKYGIRNIIHFRGPEVSEIASEELKKRGVKAVRSDVKDFEEAEKVATTAARQLGRIEGHQTVRAELTKRNWLQVKYADTVFAVGNLVKAGTILKYDKKALIAQVEGGTGNTVQMAINDNTPVFVYNQKNSKGFKQGWYKWDTRSGRFVALKSTPVLTQQFAGVGASELAESGKSAIKDLFANTFETKIQNVKSTEKALERITPNFITEHADRLNTIEADSRNKYVRVAINKEDTSLGEDMVRAVKNAHLDGYSFVLTDRVSNTELVELLNSMGALYIIYSSGATNNLAMLASEGARKVALKSSVPSVETEAWYSNETVKKNKDKIYVFGDNVKRTGKAGQAIIRDNINAFGIATKMKPSTTEGSYFDDKYLAKNKVTIDKDISAIKKQGKIVVFPEKGIGTNLAALEDKAPKTWEYLNKRLLEEFGFDNEEGKVVRDINEVAIVDDTTYSWGQLKMMNVYPSADKVNTVTPVDWKTNFEHYGNPFRGENAAIRYGQWLAGKDVVPGNNEHAELIGKQLQWILGEVKNGKLTGKTLLYPATKNTQNTHAKELAKFAADYAVYFPSFEELNNDETKKNECAPGGGIGKAALGLAPTLTAGGTWELVKDLKGLPSHKSGGVQLSINDGNVHFTDGDSTIHAANGLVLPKEDGNGNSPNALARGSAFLATGINEVADVMGEVIEGVMPFNDKNVMKVGIRNYLKNIKNAAGNTEMYNKAMTGGYEDMDELFQEAAENVGYDLIGGAAAKYGGKVLKHAAKKAAKYLPNRNIFKSSGDLLWDGLFPRMRHGDLPTSGNFRKIGNKVGVDDLVESGKVRLPKTGPEFTGTRGTYYSKGSPIEDYKGRFAVHYPDNKGVQFRIPRDKKYPMSIGDINLSDDNLTVYKRRFMTSIYDKVDKKTLKEIAKDVDKYDNLESFLKFVTRWGSRYGAFEGGKKLIEE